MARSGTSVTICSFRSASVGMATILPRTLSTGLDLPRQLVRQGLPRRPRGAEIVALEHRVDALRLLVGGPGDVPLRFATRVLDRGDHQTGVAQEGIDDGVLVY